MKLSAYLSPSRHGVYYFRWPIPECEHRKRQTARISLRTKCRIGLAIWPVILHRLGD